jgi:hypothetical protein
MKRFVLFLLIVPICRIGCLTATPDTTAIAKEPIAFNQSLPPSLSGTSFSSPELWYQRGLTEKKLGDPIAASLFFRRALLLDPTLRPARKELSTLLGALGVPFSMDWRDQVLMRIHPDLLIFGGAILGWIGILLLVGLLLLRDRKPSFKKSAFIALALTAIILGHGLSLAGSFIDPRRIAAHLAVVTAKNAPTLRATPADSAKAIGTLLPSSLITILSRNDLWWYVSDGSGHRGWILSNTITPLLPASAES